MVGGGIVLSPPLLFIIMKEDFTNYDIKPEGFLNYLRYYGQHFNQKLFNFICKQFGKVEYTKEKIDSLLQNASINIDNAKLYDTAVLANWCKHTLFGSSIIDERHLLLFIKDIYEKEGDLVFNRWYADMAKQGIPIDWEEMI